MLRGLAFKIKKNTATNPLQYPSIFNILEFCSQKLQNLRIGQIEVPKVIKVAETHTFQTQFFSSFGNPSKYGITILSPILPFLLILIKVHPNEPITKGKRSIDLSGGLSSEPLVYISDAGEEC